MRHKASMQTWTARWGHAHYSFLFVHCSIPAFLSDVNLFSYYSQEILHKKKGEKTLQILKVHRVERFFPFGCAGLASIFHFQPTSEALGARSLSSKLTIGRDSQSLEVVEALQAPLASVVDPLLLLLLTVERLSVFHVALRIKNYIIRKFHPKILF